MDGGQIRKLRYADRKLYEQMETAIEDDYILKIFPRLVEEGAIGFFIGNRLVSLAAVTIFAEKYAILGRLRTDVRERGKGYSTILLRHLLKEVRMRKELKWVGLTTRANNFPVHRIANKLGMKKIWAFRICRMTAEGERALATRGTGNGWRKITNIHEVKKSLQKLKNSPRPPAIFPYSAYYPLPFDPDLWDDAYLETCLCLQKDDRIVLCAPEDKGESYFHVKYFGKDPFASDSFWPLLVPLAKKAGRRLWIDLPENSKEIENIPENGFEQQEWTLWGAPLDQDYIVEEGCN